MLVNLLLIFVVGRFYIKYIAGILNIKIYIFLVFAFSGSLPIHGTLTSATTSFHGGLVNEGLLRAPENLQSPVQRLITGKEPNQYL